MLQMALAWGQLLHQDQSASTLNSKIILDSNNLIYKISKEKCQVSTRIGQTSSTGFVITMDWLWARQRILQPSPSLPTLKTCHTEKP